MPIKLLKKKTKKKQYGNIEITLSLSQQMLKTNVTFQMYISNLSEKALDLICILKTYACFPLYIFRVKRATYHKKYAKCIYNIVFFSGHGKNLSEPWPGVVIQYH